MEETSDTILSWAHSTFGPRTPVNVIRRLAREVAELCETTDHERLEAEAADVAIMCAQVIALCGAFTEFDVVKLGKLRTTDAQVIGCGMIAARYAAMYGTMNNPRSSLTVINYAREMIEICDRLCITTPLKTRVNNKMAINRDRCWETVDGVTQHVK